ncbi:MAG: ABC transporter substrate-binding protein, partial [Anaerolineae bacterium]
EQKVFTYADIVPYPDIDPRSSFSDDNRICANVYEPLVWFNPPGSAEALSPGLAISWESNPETTEWTFYLRKGVTFHDGTPFNAEAVKTAIEKTIELGQGAAFIWWMVEEIEVVDDYTVRFRLSAPAPLDLIASSGYAAWIFSPSVADKPNEWFNEGHDGGTGPYTIESYEPGSRVVLSRFDEYWGGWRDNQYDKVVFLVVEDAATRIQMINAGEADFTWSIPYENLPVLEANPDLVVRAAPSFMNTFIRMNNAKPPLDNVLVRKALAYSFPYEAVIQQAFSGYMTQAHGPIPAGILGHSDELFQYSYDLDRARELLAEAGYPNGGFKLHMSTFAGNESVVHTGEIWKAELAKLGIETSFDVLTWTAHWELSKSDPETAPHMGIWWWWPTYVTAYDWFFNLYHCEDEIVFNVDNYCNPEFDALIDEAATLEGADPAAAEAIYIKAQEILIDESVDIFIGDMQHITVIRSGIQGYVDNPGYPNIVFAYQLSDP